tara:strand:- start:340 stop:609 length:270 start_codon:yes stop_codon:yes gene_type:complete
MKKYEIVNLVDGYGIEVDGKVLTHILFHLDPRERCFVAWSCKWLWRARLKKWRLEQANYKADYAKSIRMIKSKKRQEKINKMRLKEKNK